MNLAWTIVVVVCLGISTEAQEQQFVGEWQTRTSRTKKTPAIAVNIIENSTGLKGAIKLANPDQTQYQLTIAKVEAQGNTLEFQTEDDKGWKCQWKLTLNETKKRGLLTGGCGEMLFEEKVSKRK
jgi:hypothetical protein